MLYQTWAALLFLLWLIARCVYNLYLHPLRAIPGPFLAKVSRAWLFYLEMKGNPHDDILDKHRIYGSIMRISPSEISFNDLDAFAEIYGQPSKFEKADYFYRAFEDQAPNLFTLRDRQQHSFDRRLMSHAFSRANILSHQDLIYTKTTFLMRRLKELAMAGREIPLFHALRCLTLDTIGEFAFGKSTGALQLGNFRPSTFEAIDKATGSVPFFQHFPFLREILRWATYYKISAVPNGFLELGQRADDGFHETNTQATWTMFNNMLSAAAKKSTELNKEHLISEGILMIVAGTDTTAAALTFTIHHLLQQPELYNRLQAEAKTVISTSETRPPFQDIDVLPFLDACIKEGLRVSCPSRVRLPRVVPEGGWSFKGHYFPAGAIVSLSPLYFLNDEAMFPSPKVYDPLRWLGDDSSRRERLSYFHPFSRGTRQCIGQNLSLVEQKIVLAMFVRQFNPQDVFKKNLNIREAITVIIDDPVNVRLNIAAD